MACDDCSRLQAEANEARLTIAHLERIVERNRASRQGQDELKRLIKGQLDKSSMALSEARLVLAESAKQRDEARRLLADVERRLAGSDNETYKP